MVDICMLLAREALFVRWQHNQELKEKHANLCINCRWDLFPGISSLDLPGSTAASTSTSNGSSEIRSYQHSPVPKSSDKQPVPKPPRSSRQSLDLLSRTFDVQDFEAAEYVVPRSKRCKLTTQKHAEHAVSAPTP